MFRTVSFDSSQGLLHDPVSLLHIVTTGVIPGASIATENNGMPVHGFTRIYGQVWGTVPLRCDVEFGTDERTGAYVYRRTIPIICPGPTATPIEIMVTGSYARAVVTNIAAINADVEAELWLIK